jgi:hypothetical protein
MTEKIDLEKLITGFGFPPATFKLDTGKISAYVRAVEDITRIYEDSNSVPPMAVAALAMAAMGRQMELPPGSIHVSQEFEFTNVVKLGETLTSYATVKRNLARGKLHMLTIGVNVVNREKNTVVSGETGFILPRS